MALFCVSGAYGILLAPLVLLRLVAKFLTRRSADSFSSYFEILFVVIWIACVLFQVVNLEVDRFEGVSRFESRQLFGSVVEYFFGKLLLGPLAVFGRLAAIY